MGCGVHELGATVAELRPFIDWSPFFSVWQLRGVYPTRGYPKIFEDKRVGEQARRVFDDAQALLDELSASGAMTARAVVGLFRAAASADGEDVELEGGGGADGVRLCMLRQQEVKEGPSSATMLSQADFVAPRTAGGEAQDHVGMYAGGVFGAEALVEAAEAEHDEYRKLLVQSVADRLAEALAEFVHREVRVRVWAYSPDEALEAGDLHKVKYQGVRPAPGYPSQPDHTEKRKLWAAMQVEERTGVKLTESLAMWPPASVCALLFAHPEAQYFAVGHVGKDQVASYAERKGMSVEEAEKWLAPVLGYNPDA